MDVLPWQHAVNRSGLSVFLRLGVSLSLSLRCAIVTPDVLLVMNRDRESVYWVGIMEVGALGGVACAYLNH